MLDPTTLLARQAVDRPGAVAVDDGDRTLTYGDLGRRVGRLARRIADTGATAGAPVPVIADMSLDAVAALHAILAAGCCYAPLDPALRPRQMAGIIASLDPPLVLVDERHAALLGTTVARAVRTVVLDPAHDNSAGTGAGWWPSGAREATSDAYVLHTSGSTSEAKGVVHSVASLAAFLRWSAELFNLDQSDRVLSWAPLHFDISLFDLLAPAVAGAAVVVAPPAVRAFPAQMPRFLADRGVSIAQMVPSAWVPSLNRCRDWTGLAGLRHLLLTGERLRPRIAVALARSMPGAAITNVYGMTEANDCFAHRYAPGAAAHADADTDSVPIGRPVNGFAACVIDGSGREAVPGDEGELYVTGPTLMTRYWDDPASTAQALVADPTGRSDRIWYRTRDLVAVDPDGTVVWRRRVDGRAKVRGRRYDLDRVDSAVLRQPGVLDALTIVVEDERSGLEQLAVFVIAAPDSGLDRADLTRVCQDVLPAGAPVRCHVVSELPRTSRGKVDMGSLRRGES